MSVVPVQFEISSGRAAVVWRRHSLPAAPALMAGGLSGFPRRCIEMRSRRRTHECAAPRKMKRIGILLSPGRGSNFLAIADSIAAGRLDAEIAVVISNRPRRLPGLFALAEERGFHTARLPRVEKVPRSRSVRSPTGRRASARITLSWFCPGRLHAHPERILHPRIPASDPEHPPFAAARVSRARRAAPGDRTRPRKFTGCTVHFGGRGSRFRTDHPASRRSDSRQRQPAISLSARILVEEHRIYTARDRAGASPENIASRADRVIRGLLSPDESSQKSRGKIRTRQIRRTAIVEVPAPFPHCAPPRIANKKRFDG